MKIKTSFHIFLIRSISLQILCNLILIINAYADDPIAISTFQCIGLYWNPSEGSVNQDCEIQYRNRTSQQWLKALSLWYDNRNREYRGSIVNLEPDTEYEIQLSLKEINIVENLNVTTMSENLPISRTIYLDQYSNQTLTIEESGTSDGYICYAPFPGRTATIDVQFNSDANIKISGNASFVIIRGLILKGAAEHAILFNGPAHDILIEDNNISGWGSENQNGYGQLNYAIFAGINSPVKTIIIQRNKIHSPQWDTNSWELGHPEGPVGIGFFNSMGHHIIRYNEIYSENGNYFKDAIGAGKNDSYEGFPNCDTDIYCNYISNAWDDGIEAEGGNKNVRIWENYIENTFVKIAIAPTSLGPIYIWRNLGGASRRSHIIENSDNYGRGPFIKTGGEEPPYNGGRAYIFHNSDLNPDPSPGQSMPLGSAGGLISAGGDTYEHIAKNNIFTNYLGNKVFEDNSNSCSNILDYNMYYGEYKNNCAQSHHESHGIELTGYNWWDYMDSVSGFFINFTGIFPLKSDSPGIDAGSIIPNFNDIYLGHGPDIGAFERGSNPLEFGVNAYKNKTGSKPNTAKNLRINN